MFYPRVLPNAPFPGYRDRVFLGRVLGTIGFVAVVFWSCCFVIRLPALWVDRYSERLTERPAGERPKVRGDFLVRFGVWLMVSRFRSAVYCIVMLYLAIKFWRFEPIIPR